MCGRGQVDDSYLILSAVERLKSPYKVLMEMTNLGALFISDSLWNIH